MPEEHLWDAQGPFILKVWFLWPFLSREKSPGTKMGLGNVFSLLFISPSPQLTLNPQVLGGCFWKEDNSLPSASLALVTYIILKAKGAGHKRSGSSTWSPIRTSFLHLFFFLHHLYWAPARSGACCMKIRQGLVFRELTT